MADLVGSQIGNYIVRSRLGQGGMGTVYLCEHPLLGRKSALKVLHDEHARDPVTVDRFFTEAKATNEIHQVVTGDRADGPDAEPARQPAVATPSPPAQPPALPTAQSALPPLAVERVTVTISTDPAGARVTRVDAGGGATLLADTRLALQVDKGSPPFDIEVSHAGHVTRRHRVDTDVGRELVLALEPAPVAQPATASPPPATRRPASKPASRRTTVNPDLKPPDM